MYKNCKLPFADAMAIDCNYTNINQSISQSVQVAHITYNECRFY